MSEIHLVNTEAWRPDQNHEKHDVKQAENCSMSADMVKRKMKNILKKSSQAAPWLKPAPAASVQQNPFNDN